MEKERDEHEQPKSRRTSDDRQHRATDNDREREQRRAMIFVRCGGGSRIIRKHISGIE